MRVAQAHKRLSHSDIQATIEQTERLIYSYRDDKHGLQPNAESMTIARRCHIPLVYQNKYRESVASNGRA